MTQTTLPDSTTRSLSVAMIARNEERYIGAALASVIDLADEVVVLLDERTRDTTASICRSYGVRLYTEPWRGFPAQRNRALELCSGRWVLFLDADERVTPELAAEVQAIVASESESTTVGYWIPRHNQFFGKVVRGGGWYPDHQLRLLQRGRAHYDEARLVHELVQLDGTSDYLKGHLLHINIEQFGEFFLKQRSYAIQEAHTLYRQGQRARWRNLVGGPAREFRRRYLQLGGYRDGQIGLFLCSMLAYFELVKYVHLLGLTLIKGSPGHKTLN